MISSGERERRKRMGRSVPVRVRLITGPRSSWGGGREIAEVLARGGSLSAPALEAEMERATADREEELDVEEFMVV